MAHYKMKVCDDGRAKSCFQKDTFLGEQVKYLSNHHSCNCICRFSNVLTLVTVLSFEATWALALVTTDNIRALGAIFAGFVDVANVAVYKNLKSKNNSSDQYNKKLVYSLKLI